jgi:uncharacterized surface protein with fasciclin (FAS1) repeats/predicted lipoprotein with Yx(FWY)xxD motif
MKNLFKNLMAGMFVLLAFSCQEDEPAPQPAPDLVQAANAAGLTTLLAAVEAVPGLAPALLNSQAITVFAPTNDAFANALTVLEAANLDELVEKLGGVDGLETVLGFHVVPAIAFAADLNASNNFTTLSGQELLVERSGNSVTITDATGAVANVVAADVTISNGVVHVIDRVLLPEIDALQPSTLTIKEDPNLGFMFADANGRSLYYFSRDVNGDNNCSGGCANNWPIFYAEEINISNPAFDASLIGTIEVDGENQTTYNGWPLYYFANDENGSVNGDGVGSVWFAAKPDYSIMIANGQLVGNNGENYIINEAGEYVNGEGNTQYYIDFQTGRTLYRFINDEADQSNFGGNPSVWPLYTTEIDQLPSLISTDDLNVIENNQLSFRANPLYFFGSDEDRGDTKGVSVPNPGVWPIVNNDTPELEPIPNLVEAATVAELTILLDAVVAAGLADALLEADEITVFAPTNDAFVALLETLEVETLEELIEALGADAVVKVLQFHVVPAVAFSTDLAEGSQTVPTLAGENLTVIRTGNSVTVIDSADNTYNVVVADVQIQNGVVHVIDGVLLPNLD